MKPNRLAAYALLLVFLFLALEYSWVQSPHAPYKGRRRGWGLGAMRSGCPADATQRKDFGAADYHWSLKTLDGKEISFSQFRGKPVFLNVWATWCGPCVEEMPEIEALAEAMKGRDVAFVLLSEESVDEVKEFVLAQGLTAPIYVANGKLPEVFESEGIPATFIVDAQGKIVFRRVGAAAWNNDACLNYLRGLL